MTVCNICKYDYIADLALAHADRENICYICRDRLGMTFKECDRADAQIYYNVHKKKK